MRRGWRQWGAGGLAGAVAMLAVASSAAEPPELSIVVDAEGALGLRGPHSQKLEVVAQPELHWGLGADTRLTAIGRIRADAFDRIEPHHPRAAGASSQSRRGSAGDHLDFELRELFIETQWGRTWFTLGKQQIVWGQADGLKVLDVVNPQSFREFILDEFDDSRIPLWAMNAEIPIGEASVQLLWLPDPTFHELPEPDSTFAFTAPRFLPPRVPGHFVSVESPHRPRRLLADSDAGIRVAAFVAGFDLSLNYLYHTDDRPIFDGQRGTGPFGPSVVFTPRYERTHLLGGTFSNAFGDLTFRGELGWTSDRVLSVEDSSDRDLLGRTEELAYVLGLDWFGFDDTLLSFQIFQSWLLRDEPAWLRDRLDTNLSFVARRELWNERLRVEGIWIHNANDGDGLLRPKLSFELRDGLTLWAGVDIFYGRSGGVFGEFDGRDRAVMGMQWGW